MMIKVNIERSERVIGKFFRSYFTLTIGSTATVALKIGVLQFLKRKRKEGVLIL